MNLHVSKFADKNETVLKLKKVSTIFTLIENMVVHFFKQAPFPADLHLHITAIYCYTPKTTENCVTIVLRSSYKFSQSAQH